MKLRGHALKKPDPQHLFRWECYCGAYGGILCGPTPTARERGRREEHERHKCAVVESKTKREDVS